MSFAQPFKTEPSESSVTISQACGAVSFMPAPSARGAPREIPHDSRLSSGLWLQTETLSPRECDLLETRDASLADDGDLPRRGPGAHLTHQLGAHVLW